MMMVMMMLMIMMMYILHDTMMMISADWKVRPQHLSKALTALSLPIRKPPLYHSLSCSDDDGDENEDHGAIVHGDGYDEQNVFRFQGAGHVQNVCHTVGRKNIHLGH